MKIIEDAEKATVEIGQNIDLAVSELSQCNGRVVNGYGVYSDPSSRRANLLKAKRVIEAALMIDAETNWPKLADYDSAEN
ncbi:hypothetical protein [Ruegeria atlantica]|uniref:hypothetical protein n=1 Tax=Ruegeria atlantica TaxID=81569 RepID=UPI001480EA54|nr:hypothetical protein [Ruegeria atlantica]